MGDFLGVLGRSSFAGIVVVELHPFALHAGRSDEKVRDRIHQAVDFCRRNLAEASAAQQPATQSSR